MKSPLPLLALLASLAPLSATAQYSSPPGYTFGGMFPGMFGGTDYTVPQGYMNRGQRPFMTMPAPLAPFTNPQFPPAATGQPSPFPANPMAQPTPFWMQTPANPRPNPRYITDAPTNEATPPNYTFFTAPGFTAPGFAAPGFMAGPPRWAPMPGQGPVTTQRQRPANNWSAFPNSGQAAPAIPATPPKWPTP
jgi:hypothetical protein